jgi:hypothetical protein
MKGLRLREDPDLIASSIHYMYIGELRVWLGEPAPRIEAVMVRLRRLFSLVVHGIFE